MTDWTFKNISKEDSPTIAVRSIQRSVELVMRESGEFSQAPTMEFMHAHRGVICITAGHEFGIISFDSNYDDNKPHTLRGFKHVSPRESVTTDDLVTYDDACGASTIRAAHLISILEVIAVLEYLLEHHDYAPFVEWRPGA